MLFTVCRPRLRRTFSVVHFARFAALVTASLAVTGCGTSSGPAREAGREPERVVREEADPTTRAKAHTELAAAYYSAGNIAIALDEVRIALAADSRYAPAHNVQGLVHMELRENAQAEQSFERAISYAPDDPDVRHNYGWFLCQTGRVDRGIASFHAAIKNPLYKAAAKSNMQAGLCLLNNSNNDAEAMRYFERAEQVDPEYAPVLLPHAQLLYRRGDIDGARTLVNRYNGLADPSAESLWLALRIERRRGDQVGETSYGSQLRRRFPMSKEARALELGQYQ